MADNGYMDLTTATPVEIDTALAEIYNRLYTTQDEIKRQIHFIEDLEGGIEKEAAGDGRYTGYLRMYGDKLLDMRTNLNALRERATDILAETAPYEAEYQRRPWTRFFLVQNNGGHIHSSMSCSTCYITTRFGWLPNLSGLTEAEAVAAHGAILCTVCYPSAPVEWTDGRDDSVCPGSGQHYDTDQKSRVGYYSGNWGHCVECGKVQTITKIGNIRKHKKEESK